MKNVSIIDPICILPYGHNMGALEAFGNLFECVGSKVTVHVAKEYSGWLPNNIKVRNSLTHNHSFIADTHLTNNRFQEFVEQIKIICETSDEIFFPGVDYISLCALRQILSEKNSFPIFKIRFIGVMENEEYNLDDFTKVGVTSGYLKILADIINISKENGVDIRLFAETKVFAEYIQSQIHNSVHVLPYPLKGQLSVRTQSKVKDTFTIGFLGAPREDKGYFNILEILKSFKDEELTKLRFLIQPRNPKDSSIHNSTYEIELSKIPCVEFTNYFMDDAQMNAAYLSCDCLCLPYHSDVYKLRGSAILFEAVKYLIPVISVSGLAFNREVVDYNLGLIADNINSIPSIVSKMREGAFITDYRSYMEFNHYSSDMLVS